MAVAAADALLDAPGTLRVRLKQMGVVVRLDEERVRAAQAIADEIGDEAHVAEHAEARFLVLDHETHGVYRIVRHGEALDAHVMELERGAGLHELPFGARLREAGLLESLLRERS